jgi:hypothetical protein
MTARTLFPLVALLSLFAAPPACRADVAEGTRVRVSILERRAAPDSLFFVSGFEPGKRLVGTFVGADSSAITIGDEKGFERAIPNEIVSQFEVSAGRKSRAGRGAVIGLIAGTVAGFAIGTYVDESEGDCGDCFPGDGAYQMGITLGGAILGTGVGALVGALIKTERWRRAESRPRP